MTTPELEVVQRLEAELFTPALQQAFTTAKQAGHSKADTLFAAANAYQNMLVAVLGGKKEAADFMQQQLDFLSRTTQ